MKKRKVLHIVSQLNFGGVESHIKTIADNFGFTNFDHQFCVIGHGGAVSDQLLASDKLLTILGVRSRIPSLIAFWELICFIRRNRPDILHTRGAEANFHGLIAGRICRVPICIAEEIGLPNHSGKARFIFRQAYRLADCVLAISEAVKCRIVDLNEANANKIVVLPNPVQMLTERQNHTSSDCFRIGFVGRLEAIKNPKALVQAAGFLRSQALPVTVTIVGDGSQRMLLEEEISRLKLHDIVNLFGFDPNPFEHLKNVDLYVQPSISEGFGLALVEAMSVGIPVLATSVGGTSEIITDGENGWLLTDTDPETISRAIKKCFELGSVELHSIGKIGRKSIVERFSPTAYFKACDALYTALIQERM